MKPSALLALIALAACKSADVTTDGGVQLETFPVLGSLGISGLARAPDGVLYALPERDRRLIRIPPSGPIDRLAIRGAPEGVDLEALAWVGGATLAFGTESRGDDRLKDPIYFGVISSTGIELEQKLIFDYGAFSSRATRNAGIESLCAADGKVVAASELVLERTGKRIAPVMVFDLTAGGSTRHNVSLSTEVDKLAGMTCRVARQGGALEVLAIERHYATSVVIRFFLPFAEKNENLVSEVIFDLGARMKPPPNFEAIEWISEEEVLLASDNQYRTQTGETQMVRLTVPLHNPAR